MQQGLEYATTLDIPFVFFSNGDAFLLHDRTGTSTTPTASGPGLRMPTAMVGWSMPPFRAGSR